MRYCEAGGCLESAHFIGKFTDHTAQSRTVAACNEEHQKILTLALKLAGIQADWKPFEFKGRTDGAI